MEKKTIAMLSMLCGVLAFSACNTPQDVPVPEDEKAKEWAPAIKESYSDWQSTKEAPKGNSEYESMFKEPVSSEATEDTKKSAAADADLKSGEIAPVDKVEPVAADPVVEAEKAQYPFLYAPAPVLVRLDIMEDGKILVDGNEYPIEIVEKYVAKVAKDNGAASVAIIRPASVKTSVEKSNQAIDLCRKAGIAAVRFVNPGKAAAPAAKTPAAPAKRVKYVVDSAVAPQTYVVQPGDSLGKISLKFYKSIKYVNFILDANPKVKANPNKIRSGMKLVIPAIKAAE